MKKFILLIPLIIGCNLQQNYSTDNNVGELISQANDCFSQAEKEILGNVPKPDDVVGPHPDPAKCICKGTGIITQGDGHTSPCPYHAKKEPEPEIELKPEPEPEPEVEPKPKPKPIVYEESTPTGRIIRRY